MPTFARFIERYQQYRDEHGDSVPIGNRTAPAQREWARAQLEAVILPTVRRAREALATANIVMVFRNWTDRETPQIRLAVSGTGRTTHFLDFIGRDGSITTIYGTLDSGDEQTIAMRHHDEVETKAAWVSSEIVTFLELALMPDTR